MRMTSAPAKKSARIFCLWFVLLFLAASPLLAQQAAVEPPPTVVFMTDFGVADDSVAICKGVMYGIAPNLRIVDLTHQVSAFDSRRRSLPLRRRALLPGRNGICGGRRSRRRQFAQGCGGEIQARAILRAARQRPDDH